MQYIADQMGDSIPVLRGDRVSYWDWYENRPSNPLARETDHRVLTAEKFSTVSSLVNPRIWPDRQVMDQLWKGLLTYGEHHGWGGQTGTLQVQLHEEELLALYNARLTEQVLARGMSALADSIQAPSGTLIVFNALNWQRSKLVKFNLGRGLEVVDRATNQVVPVEELPVLSAGGPGRGGRGGGRMRFLATDVPAVGYRCYTLRTANTATAAPANITGRTLENAYYRVVLDPASGAIQSLFDKDLNRELVDQASPYRFN